MGGAAALCGAMTATDFFTFPESLAPLRRWFDDDAAPWEWLPKVAEALAGLPAEAFTVPAGTPVGVHVEGRVFIDPTVKLPPYAVIQGPAWIGPQTEIRPGAYIRGNVIAGQGCVLGNSSEFKNCLLLDAVQAPHFNYVGDSILGNGAHLGAGVILANLRLDQQNVPVVTAEGRKDSGLRKLGGIFGDYAEAGCNTVINPGTLLGRRAVVMPGNPFSGYLAEGEIALTVQEVRRIKRRG